MDAHNYYVIHYIPFPSCLSTMERFLSDSLLLTYQKMK